MPKLMITRARELRNGATDTERTLWRLLSRYRPAFTRQLVIDDRYIVDLANRTAKLAIEVDGSQHINRAHYDAERTAYLEALGWRVIRLWNNEVLANPEGAASFVLAQAAECLGGTHPQPSVGSVVPPARPEQRGALFTRRSSREGRERRRRFD